MRAVELAGAAPILFAGMMLADMGAEVIQIDRPREHADLPEELGVDRTGPLGRGRHVLILDLRERKAVEVLLRLVERSEVMIEGFRPGVVERLGVGPEAALARNPDLVYGRMTGWGQDGPLAARAGHDICYLAVSGLLHGIGPRDGSPLPPANYICDLGGGGLVLVAGVVAAVLRARAGGGGQVVDAAMTEGAAYLGTMVGGMVERGVWRDERESNLLDGGAPNYRCYECADGRFVAVGALEPRFWSILVGGLGLDPAGTPDPWDRSRWAELTRLLEAVFATRGRDEWAELFGPLDACVAPVLTMAEARGHEQARDRGSFVEENGSTLPRPVPRMSATPPALAPPAAPATDELLLRAGLRPEEIRRLRA